MNHVSLKYANSSSVRIAIRTWGFTSAFSFIFNKIKQDLKLNPAVISAGDILDLYEGVIKNSKKFRGSELVYQQKLELAGFYRKLAHSVYWYQRKNGLAAIDIRFIQEV